MKTINFPSNFLCFSPIFGQKKREKFNRESNNQRAQLIKSEEREKQKRRKNCEDERKTKLCRILPSMAVRGEKDEPL